MSAARWSYEWARAEARERNDRLLAASRPRTPGALAWFAFDLGDGRWCAGAHLDDARERANALDDADVFEACERVESRDGPWWGPGCIARELDRTEGDVVPALERLMAQGRVDSDVCGAGPDGVQVLAWWLVREALTWQVVREAACCCDWICCIVEHPDECTCCRDAREREAACS